MQEETWGVARGKGRNRYGEKLWGYTGGVDSEYLQPNNR